MLDSDTVHVWFYGYIDLLQRFRLFNIATCVTRLCPLEEVRLTQLDNTYILSNCTVCLRALSKAGGAWYCDRCWRPQPLLALPPRRQGTLRLVSGLRARGARRPHEEVVCEERDVPHRLWALL